MLDLVIGREGSGKSRWLIEKVKQLTKSQDQDRLLAEKIYFLVPDQYSLQCERDLISGLSLEGTLSLEVLSLSRLASRVFSEVGGASRVMMNPQGQTMILRRVFEEVKEELTFFSRPSPGLLEEILLLNTSMRRNKVDMAHLQAACQRQGDQRTAEKMADLSRLYQAYQAALAQDYLDEEEAYRLLKEKLPQSKAFSKKDIFVDGFSRFSQQGLDILEALLLLGNRLHLALFYDDRQAEGSLFAEQKKILDRLRAFCGQHKIKMKLSRLDHIYRPEALAHLQTSLYAFPFSPYQKEAAQIRLVECKDRTQEVERLVKEISFLLEKKDLQPSDLAVVCDDLDGYQGLFRRAFEAAGIPAHIDKAMPLIHHPFIRFVLLSLRAVETSYSRDHMRAHLSSVFVDLAREDKEALENHILARGIQGHSFVSCLDQAKVKTEAKKEGEEEKVDLDACYHLWLGPLLALAKGLSKESVREKARALYHYIDQVGCVENLQAQREKHLENKAFLEAARSSQVYRVFMEVLEQMVSLLGEEKMETADFSQTLEAGLFSEKLAQIPSGLDQVLVGSLARTKSQDIKVLFVLGLNEGVLPREMAEFPLLAPQQVDQLLEAGIDLGLDIKNRYRQEKIDFLQALSKAGQSVYLSYALIDEAGAGLRPSPYLRRIQKIFPGLTLESDLGEGLVENRESPDEEKSHILTPLPAWPSQVGADLRRLVRDYQEKRELSAKEIDFLATVYRGDPASLEKFFQAAFLRPPSFFLSQAASQALYGPAPALSVSRLQKMAACPFAHFIAYGLRPKKRPLAQVDAADLGSFFHEVLFHFGRLVQKEGLVWADLDAGVRGDLLDRALTKSLAGIKETHLVQDPLLSRYRQMMDQSIVKLKEGLENGALSPSFFEISFGKKGILPPLLVEVQGSMWEIEGTIDRADVYYDQARALIRLIDYKSGQKSFDFLQFYHGINLQLPLYAEVLASSGQALGLEEVCLGSALYFHLASGPVSVPALDEASIEKKITDRFKMRGLVLEDLEVVRRLDESIEGGRSQTMHGISLKTNGDFAKGDSLLKGHEWDLMGRFVRKKAGQIAQKMASGQVGIQPYRLGKKEIACTYCAYKAMCFYEVGRTQHRKLSTLPEFEGKSKKRVLKKMEEEDA